MIQPTVPNRNYHDPVMVDEVLHWLEPVADGVIVDGTFGGGGHSRALLGRYPRAHVVGIDRDPDALEQAPDDERLSLVSGNYRFVAEIIRDEGHDAVDGILLDLGVSSHQLDVPGRGFSYREDGPLDMRMGPDAPRSAADLVNEAEESDLATILWRYGDERFSRRIAAAIVRDRPFTSTLELADSIAGAVPAAARRAKHPARKSFQAIRIAVNDELTGVEDALEGAIAVLRPGGRIVVMAYHSLEDRIVKSTFVERSRTCTCPPEIPVCVCGASPELAVLTRKPVRASDAELERNPRARSAVLRVAERTSNDN